MTGFVTRTFNSRDAHAIVASVNAPTDPISSERSEVSTSSSVGHQVNSQNSDPLADQISNRVQLPVSVLLERRLIKRSFWSVPSWYLSSVAVGDDLQANFTPGELAYRTDSGDVYAWSGFTITLYRDACERYWHALIGDKPQVYVMCREVEDSGESEAGVQDAIEPIHVTIDYDDASAYAETDQMVLSAAIPPELYRYMEQFVLTHYEPKEFKKRKRRKWSEDEGKRQGPRGGGYR